MSARRRTAEIRLGVNVDHIATIREARGTPYPDPVDAARLALAAGADSITVHLREDRRHIQDRDVERLCATHARCVNLEMAVTPEMVDIACRLKPACVCLVPERREELTTEGGLDVAGQLETIRAACSRLARSGIAVALFIDAEARQLKAAKASGAPHLEIHTGRYADTRGRAQQAEIERIARFAASAQRAGFEVHAGHGLTVDNVGAIAAIRSVVELNIGHSIVARALTVGLPMAVAEMRGAMLAARDVLR